ncbi:serine/threonine protein kinase [Pseudomonas sp. MYb185]|uniref:serine/threonine protein kinase n=1 Tax=Pseudomonas sp. MYb185 TaxID=1848729 RepID=UPI000CFC0F1F|nr:serine/threonine protein kinase [Pseudomonas sp. MYb185]PRB82085.1 serine/threonine protein kinase [Pseudomonas sp. MYb185]
MNRYLHYLYVSLLALAGSLAHADDSSYPVTNPFLATIVGTPPQLAAPVPPETEVRQTDLAVTVLPERHLPPALSRYHDLHYRLAWHNEPAPLIFLIAGTGSGYSSPRLDYLKRVFWQAGMHVIILSSPTNHDFIAAASRSGLPGLGLSDARDLHTAMSMAVEHARDKKNLQITEYRLAGFSLGALNAAFVAHLDQSLRQFNFTRTLLLNPPVDLYASIRRLDALARTQLDGVSSGDSFYEHIFQKLARYFAESGGTDIEGGLFYGIQSSDSALTDAEMAMLIGAVFRFAAADLNFMADLVTEGGRYAPAGEKLKVSTSLTPYLRRALFCDFSCYLETQLWPVWNNANDGKSIDDMAWDTSLYSIAGFLRDNPNIAALTNADDFILTADNYRFITETFGERALLYPHGGHGGNLQHRDVVATMLHFMEGDVQ